MGKGICKKIALLSTVFTIVFLLFGRVWWFIPFTIIHEFCHCAIGVFLGYSIKKVYILPFGMKAEFKDEFIKPGDDLLISISGPLINFVFFAFFSFVENKGVEISFLKEVNLILFIFNMMPAGFLDGGRIVKNIIKINMNFYSAYLISGLSGGIFGCIISLVAILSGFSLKSIIILGLGVYLIYTGYTEQRDAVFNVVKDVLFKHCYIGERKKINIELKAFSRECQLLQIIKGFNYKGYHIIYIFEDGILGNKFNEIEITQMYCKYGNITLGECSRNKST